MSNKYGLMTNNGFEGFMDSDFPNEVVLAKGKMNFNANPVYTGSDNYDDDNDLNDGNGHVPVVLTLEKTFPGQYYFDTNYNGTGYFYAFQNCSLVLGDSQGRSCGFYGGANNSWVVAPHGYPKAVWSETDTHCIVKYVGVWSGTESSAVNTARMSGTLYGMLVGQLPPNELQEIPEYGIIMKDSAGERITFNSNYEPSIPSHYAPRPPYNINNAKGPPAFVGNMEGGIKMTTPTMIAVCRNDSDFSSKRPEFSSVWSCFSADGRRIGCRTQGWGSVSGAAPYVDYRQNVLGADEKVRVWNVKDYFDI